MNAKKEFIMVTIVVAITRDLKRFILLCVMAIKKPK